MDFSRLPDNAFLKMIGYLPLEDKIRARRVDKIFHRIGQLAISCTKSMNLTEDRFKNLTPDQMSVILELCSPKLEMIKFPNDRENGIPLASIFANYECPRLTDLDLGRSVIDYSVFDRIIRNVPNIESLAWHGKFVGFPDIVIDSLKKLKLGYVNDEILRSLTGRFPNLKEVYLTIKADSTSDVFDEFFASVPQVHVVDIEITTAYATTEVYFEEKEMAKFWNLPLTSLKIEFAEQDHPDDMFLLKTATSFPHLQSLSFSWIDVHDNGGYAALAALQELEILEIFSEFFEGNEDNEYRQLAGCRKLRKLSLHSARITSVTFIALFQSCPQLDHVMIFSIIDVDTPDKATVVLQSLTGIGKRDITIEFHGNSHDEDWFKSIWESESAKAAILKLEEKDELKIEIGFHEVEDDNSKDMDEDESMDVD